MIRPLALTIPAVTVCSRPKGLPTGHHPGAHLEVFRIPQGYRVQTFDIVDLDQCQVGRRITSDDLGIEFPVIEKLDLDLVGLGNHMIVV